MKKYFYLLFIALFTTMSVSLIGCSKDNDDEPSDTNNSIVGTYKVDVMNAGSDMWQIDYLNFKENGTYTSVSVMHVMGYDSTEKGSGTWSVSGDKITIDGLTGTIKTLNSSKMVITLGSGEIVYNRCSYSEMEKYL